jgi:hypothetical protein
MAMKRIRGFAAGIRGRRIQAQDSRKIPIRIQASEGQSKGEKQIPTEMNFDGTVELAAAEGQQVVPGKEKFYLKANSGKPMMLNGFFDPVVIDMDGAKFDKASTAIIADHKTDKRIGATVEQVIIKAGETKALDGKQLKGPLIAAVGVKKSKSQTAKEFVEDAQEGFPWQVSVGARIQDGFFVDEGDSVKVNGSTFQGPLIVASQTLIRELSVTVLGADSDTEARIAAKIKRKENHSMDFEAYLAELELTADTLTPGQLAKLEAKWKSEHQTEPPKKPVNKDRQRRTKVAATVKANDSDDDDDADDEDAEVVNRRRKLRKAFSAEESRLTGIRSVASKYDQLEASGVKLEFDGQKMTFAAAKQHAIESDDLNADAFELACLRASRSVNSSGQFGIQVVDKQVEQKALEASILRRYGVAINAKNPRNGVEYGLEKMYDAKTLEASHDRRYDVNSFDHLMHLQVQAAGRHPLSRHGSDLRAEAHRAWGDIKAGGPSTLNVVNLLENVAHKAALASFQGVEAVWPFICGRRPVTNFKAHALYRLDWSGSFRKVDASGELKHVSMTRDRRLRKEHRATSHRQTSRKADRRRPAAVPQVALWVRSVAADRSLPAVRPASIAAECQWPTANWDSGTAPAPLISLGHELSFSPARGSRLDEVLSRHRVGALSGCNGARWCRSRKRPGSVATSGRGQPVVRKYGRLLCPVFEQQLRRVA